METDSTLSEYSDSDHTDSDCGIFTDFSDSKYSPLILQKSWQYLKVARQLAQIYHRELLEQRAIDRIRDAWFDSVKEWMK